MAGANSIFYGEKLLTTGNPEVDADRQLLDDAGLTPLAPYASPDPVVQATKERGPKPKTRLSVMADPAE